MLILTYMFKHDTFYIFHPYFHKERGFGVPIFYLTGIIKKIDEKKYLPGEAIPSQRGKKSLVPKAVICAKKEKAFLH